MWEQMPTMATMVTGRLAGRLALGRDLPELNDSFADRVAIIGVAGCKRRSKAEATLIVPIAVGLSFAVVACALFIGIRRKLRKLRKPAKAPITSGPAAAEAHAPSAAARLRPEAEPEQQELAGPELELESE